MLWASSWVLIRFGLDDEQLTPLVFAGVRYAVAALLLVGAVLTIPRERTQLGRLDGRGWWALAGLGFVYFPVTQGAMFVAIDLQPAATTSLVLSLTPLLVALGSGVTLGERPTGRQLAGTLLVIAGAAVYFGGALGATTLGMAAALVALGGNVASGLVGRAVNRTAVVSALSVTAVSMAIGAAVLLAAGIAIEGLPPITARGWGYILWLAVVNTALAFTLWNRSLQTLDATESAAINNTMLIQIAVLGWWFLSEPLGVPEIAGILLVSAGIVLAQRRLPVNGRRTPARR